MAGFLEQRANLSGRTAVVIGGGGGIGAACSLALARAGVNCAICDLDGDAQKVTAAKLNEMNGLITDEVLDAAQPDQLDAFYNLVGETCNRLDIVVNVAGRTRRRQFMDVDRDENARDIQRNFGYVIQSVERAVPLIRRSGRGGSIVNFTTIEAHRGAAGFSVYAGAKAATANFTRAMAVELAAERIRLNCVVPDTTFSKGNFDALSVEDHALLAEVREDCQGKGLEIYVPQKSPPPADALADAVLFLASDMAACVTGTSLHVDGGTMAAAGFLDWPFGDGFVPSPLGGTLAALYGRKD
ncbi:SDR family oxidoreductase [Novosphingobium malaysiense]|nr:SDR family oxidoreductase [Novosphingobium malaysiense]